VTGRIRVAVVAGGRSSEHEISLASARSVLEALDPERYETTTIAIGRDGRWALEGSSNRLLQGPVSETLPVVADAAPGATLGEVDVVLPILHGPFGEDGTVQGLLELAGVPYVGPGVAASALCMDKDLFKAVLRDRGIPVARNVTLRLGDDVRNPFGYPVFVKPARLGSSVGISKAHDEAELHDAVGLTACLAELDAKEGEEATMIVRRPVAAAQRQRVGRARRRRAPLLLLALAALVLAGVVGGILLLRGDGGTPQTGAGSTVELTGVASFDPAPGDGEEHDERVADATDGDPASYWTTETYESFNKPGVGLVLDAGESRSLDRVEVTTDTPGFTAEIRAGGSPQGPFETVGEGKQAGAETSWKLDGEEARYYVVWITALDGVARVNEVSAS